MNPSGLSENPFSSSEQEKKRYEAAVEFVKLFQERTPLVGGKPHAGTVLSVAARLAGTSLFRAVHEKKYDPGIVVLSEEVNQVYPRLLNQFAYYCKQKGFDVMAKPLVKDFPEKDEPLLELFRVHAEYQDQYNEVMVKHGLDDMEGARAGMILCSILFTYHCVERKDIDPFVATGIVAMGVVEGAKTSPVPLKSEGAGAEENLNAKDQTVEGLVKIIAESSISGTGDRLILGEKEAVMREATHNGGKYILVHPEVTSKLRQSGFDPYVIHKTTLIIEMEQQISRVEFFNTDVDRMAGEWSDKPADQAPVNVGQMLWLKENAEEYGYRQSGNNWIRKS